MAYEDYEPVAARLDRWLNLPETVNPRVITVMVSEPGADICVFRAELWADRQDETDEGGGHTWTTALIATGWAEEIRNSNHITKTSHVEVCETSAIGRALANAGLAGSDWTKRASREEMQKTERYASNKPAWKQRDAERTIERAAFEGTKTIVNKLPGKCQRCGLGVDTGAGKAVNDGSGWKTFHNDGDCPPEEEAF